MYLIIMYDFTVKLLFQVPLLVEPYNWFGLGLIIYTCLDMIITSLESILKNENISNNPDS